jgi:23S rRNA (guanine2445-N2)-methyltransferase / 23S rRNA (guanine2069-N7)-methyltransferase
VTTGGSLSLVATCSLGLEELLAGELHELGVASPLRRRGAVAFEGSWRDCWRANWRLRTANRVLVELASWEARDGSALAAGARALAAGRLGPLPLGGSDSDSDIADLFHPDRSFAIHATTAASEIRDVRWAALSVKDGLVDGQRDRWGRRADVDRESPDLHLRLRLHDNQATLLLDTSGDPLDHRGYRTAGSAAPLREQLAAACVLASGWDGRGAVVDPMCGSATLLVEAGWIALGRAPGHLRAAWAFERLPGFDPAAFAAVKAEPLPTPGSGVRLFGNDASPEALRAARASLAAAGLADRATLTRGDAFEYAPPEGNGLSPGLVLVNPPHGERLTTEPRRWKELGNLLKKRFRGWRAVVLAGGDDRGKHIGLRPRKRLPVMNGALEARILLFDLF